MGQEGFQPQENMEEDLVVGPVPEHLQGTAVLPLSKAPNQQMPKQYKALR